MREESTCRHCKEKIFLWSAHDLESWLHLPRGNRYCEFSYRVAEPEEELEDLPLDTS